MIHVYTDGSCSHSGSGGWAFAAVCDNVIIAEQSGRDTDTTNNRMELTAAIRAMQWMLQEGYAGQVLVTDSKYVQGCLQVHHSKAKANLDLVHAGRALRIIVKPIITWVRGHNGNRWNEYVDKLCVSAGKRPEQHYIKDGAGLIARR